MPRRVTPSARRSKTGPIKTRPLTPTQQARLTAHPSKRIGKRGPKPKFSRRRVMTLFCESVSRGELVSDVLKKIGLTQRTLNRWVITDEKMASEYHEAMKLQARSLASRVMKTARGQDPLSKKRTRAIRAHGKELKQSGDPTWRQKVESLQSNHIRRNELEVKATQWYVKVTSPREFGDKVDVTSDNKPIDSGPKTMIVKFVGGKKG